jgi:hypothetical protein
MGDRLLEAPDQANQPLLDLDQLLEVTDHHPMITNESMKAVTALELELVGPELVEHQERLRQVPVPLHHQHKEVWQHRDGSFWTTELIFGSMTLEQQPKPGEQLYLDPPILHLLLDHPGLQQVQELREE